MKNTERIRAMTDEELAHFLATVEAKLYRDDLDIIAYRADEVADALEWLKRESYYHLGGKTSESYRTRKGTWYYCELQMEINI